VKLIAVPPAHCGLIRPADANVPPLAPPHAHAATSVAVHAGLDHPAPRHVHVDEVAVIAPCTGVPIAHCGETVPADANVPPFADPQTPTMLTVDVHVGLVGVPLHCHWYERDEVVSMLCATMIEVPCAQSGAIVEVDQNVCPFADQQIPGFGKGAGRVVEHCGLAVPVPVPVPPHTQYHVPFQAVATPNIGDPAAQRPEVGIVVRGCPLEDQHTQFTFVGGGVELHVHDPVTAGFPLFLHHSFTIRFDSFVGPLLECVIIPSLRLHLYSCPAVCPCPSQEIPAAPPSFIHAVYPP
jgi:hypothetical protein